MRKHELPFKALKDQAARIAELEAEAGRLRGLQAEAVAAIQAVRDELSRRCANEMPHDHAALRLLEPLVRTLDEIHARALRGKGER